MKTIKSETLWANLNNPAVLGFYEGFIAGRTYGADFENMSDDETPKEVEERLLAQLSEVFEAQLEDNKQDVEGLEEASEKAWKALEATVKMAISSCAEVGEETLPVALKMIGE